MAKTLEAYRNGTLAGTRKSDRPYTHAVVAVHQDGTLVVVSWHQGLANGQKGLDAARKSALHVRGYYSEHGAGYQDEAGHNARRYADAMAYGTTWELELVGDVRTHEPKRTASQEPEAVAARKAAREKGAQTKSWNASARWYLNSPQRRAAVEAEAYQEHEERLRAELEAADVAALGYARAFPRDAAGWALLEEWADQEELERAARRPTALPDEVAELLAQGDIRGAVAEAYRLGLVSHTRAGTGCWRGLVYVYAHDGSSPSGVKLLASLEEGPETEEWLRGLDRSLAPLSPTEGR